MRHHDYDTSCASGEIHCASDIASARTREFPIGQIPVACNLKSAQNRCVQTAIASQSERVGMVDEGTAGLQGYRTLSRAKEVIVDLLGALDLGPHANDAVLTMKDDIATRG